MTGDTRVSSRLESEGDSRQKNLQILPLELMMW
jgi:hypothetical protein